MCSERLDRRRISGHTSHQRGKTRLLQRKTLFSPAHSPPATSVPGRERQGLLPLQGPMPLPAFLEPPGTSSPGSRVCFQKKLCVSCPNTRSRQDCKGQAWGSNDRETVKLCSGHLVLLTCWAPSSTRLGGRETARQDELRHGYLWREAPSHRIPLASDQDLGVGAKS